MDCLRLRASCASRGGPRGRSPMSKGLASFVLVVGQALLATAANAQTLATVHLTPGWATFGQALPQGAATSGLRVGTFSTQTDVKNRWPDGSIRFAVVSLFVPAEGNFAIEPDTGAAGAFTPTIPAASVTFTIAGVAFTATQPSSPVPDRWLSGPLVYEGRSVVAPVSALTGLAHPFLRVNFDTRVYSDAQARVDVSVENVLDQIGASTVTYGVTMTVNGAPVFTKTAVDHYYLTRWRQTFTLPGTALSAVTPDLVPFNNAKALPPYLPLVADFVNTIGVNYDLLQSGAVGQDMSQPGVRGELAPYPDWTARYLVHKAPAQRAFVLANGDLSGSWPIHVREAGAVTRVRPDRLIPLHQRPSVWFDERARAGGWDFVKGLPLPIREYTGVQPANGQTALVPDNAHQPSLAFVPYLLTGDRYYAEEMAFWADYAMMRTDPGDGVRGSAGILESNELRGWGWALRHIADAAAYYPDGSPVKAYLVQKLLSILQYLESFANAQVSPSNPFQILFINRRPDGGQYISLWEQSYLAHAIDRANQHGFAGALTVRD